VKNNTEGTENDQPACSTHIYSLTSYLSINKLFSLIQNIEIMGYIFWYLWDKFELFCHLRLWFIMGKDMLYPGRICANEADKILKNSDYVTPQVT